MTITTLCLIRHAHAHWTPDEMRPLSAEGAAAAWRVADHLASDPIDVIVSSPYRRAIETVRPLADRLGLAIGIEPDLRERTLTTASLPPERFETAVRATWSNFGFTHPGGETNHAALQRGVAVVRRLVRTCPGRHIVVSTHGNLLALILHHFDPTIDYAFWSALTMPDVYRLRLGDEHPHIARRWPPSPTPPS
ncbi:MAG: histidine phosphatase family protein [Paracoccaceae bacterium]